MRELTSDVKKLWIVTVVTFAVLLPAIFIPAGYVRLTAAVLLTIAALAVWMLIKKRRTPSLNRRQVAIIMAVIAAVYLTLFYLSGYYFGFNQTYQRFTAEVLWKGLVPGAMIIMATEIIRAVLLAQSKKGLTCMSFLICILSDIYLGAGVAQIQSLNRLMVVVAMTLLPAVTANLLYHYISKRYGAVPNMAYRLILTLPGFVLPKEPNMANALESLILMLLPLAVYLFIDLLYEKKFRRATKRPSKWSYVATAAAVAVMISVVMLISCQFRFGMVVIATPSMQSEEGLDVGDAVLYEAYDDQYIQEGDIIAFTKDGKTLIVHRVVDVQKINGQLRYYTKGDANKDWDHGYVTESEIHGVVLCKVPYIGHPSLWLRGLFTS